MACLEPTTMADLNSYHCGSVLVTVVATLVAFVLAAEENITEVFILVVAIDIDTDIDTVFPFSFCQWQLPIGFHSCLSSRSEVTTPPLATLTNLQTQTFQVFSQLQKFEYYGVSKTTNAPVPLNFVKQYTCRTLGGVRLVSCVSLRSCLSLQENVFFWQTFSLTASHN